MNYIKRIHSASKSKDGKALIENFISLSALKVIGYLFPLLTLPYLARVIGVDSFGEIAFAASIIIYFETLTDFGFNYTATRDVAKHRDDIDVVSKIFSNIITARVLLMLLSALILAIGVTFIPMLYEKRILIWFTFLYIPGHIMFSEWYFQAIERMKYITIMNVLSKLVFTGLIFVIIKKQSDYIYQPLLAALGFIVSGAISLIIVFKKFKIKYTLPCITEIIDTIKNSWSMFVALFVPNMYNSFSTILLRAYSGADALGIYSAGNRFIDIADQLSRVLSRIFYPFLARRIDKHSLYVKISCSIIVVASLVLFFGADLLIRIFYTSEFTSAATVIRIMAICPIFLFLMNSYGTNYLVLIGQTRLYRKIIVWCSLFGFGLSWICVINFGYIGIAITLVTVWGIRGILTWYFAKKHQKNNQQL